MTSSSRRRLIVAAALLGAAPVLAGCGSGATANTSTPYAPTEAGILLDGDGGGYGRGGIKIPQAFVLGPESGAQIPAGGSAPLYLTMVNSTGRPETLEAIAPDDKSASSVKLPSPISMPPGKLVNTGRPASQVTVEGVRAPLRGGESLVLTLRFSGAGDVRMRVPVVTRSREFSSLSPAPEASPSGSPTPGPVVTPSPTATTTATATPTPSE
ncbi:hypothetical protein Sru01_47000 [Sphaerisporangium rufum]|uniref:Copper chaperone PCu(A)C n=1 Tax=Sphaerisporangium rufum TaxID=1381558 RepID=A0A919R5X7_9ACTN|nr:copper chaperone PCu(A)C [Sphaerisporangium rufum]GII79718.1 hypothetical protein Sru01_47000 [Sphaerisporangium rufum]